MTFWIFESELSVDVNWPAYAGKKKQASWYVLAAKLLAQNGVKIFMHGGPANIRQAANTQDKYANPSTYQWPTR